MGQILYCNCHKFLLISSPTFIVNLEHFSTFFNFMDYYVEIVAMSMVFFTIGFMDVFVISSKVIFIGSSKVISFSSFMVVFVRSNMVVYIID